MEGPPVYVFTGGRCLSGAPGSALDSTAYEVHLGKSIKDFESMCALSSKETT